MPDFEKYQKKYIPALEQELHRIMDAGFCGRRTNLDQIFMYQLGLGESSGQGKRVRPFLLFACNEGAGGEWSRAIPAGVSVELIHNFSLIHDDIADNGEFRRGKWAVWKKWGLAVGLNAGDALFSVAFDEMTRLRRRYSSEVILEALAVLSQTCLQLIMGQQLDMEFENQDIVHKDDYFQMVQGKTAALFSGSCRLGALLAGKGAEQCNLYAEFGNWLGLAFQIYDDWLGVWGDPEKTGKSNHSDLIERKKTLPILLGFEKSEEFLDLWAKGEVDEDRANYLADWLRDKGIDEIVIDESKAVNERALTVLESLECSADMQETLKGLANELLMRDY